MPTTTQKMVLDAIVDQLEAEGGTAVLDSEWSNTGTISFVPAASMTPTSKLHYSFQTGYWIIQTGRADYIASFFDTDIGKKTVEGEIAKVVEHLTA